MNSIVSMDSLLHEDICDDEEREAEEKRLSRRRCMILVTIPALFLLSCGILTTSVMFDVHASAKGNLEWEEFSCQPYDSDCLALLCPDGMVWDMMAGKCRAVSGYTCCTSCTLEYMCYKAEEADGVKCCSAMSVVPSAYKQNCREGFIWVEWKQKCLRQN